MEKHNIFENSQGSAFRGLSQSVCPVNHMEGPIPSNSPLEQKYNYLKFYILLGQTIAYKSSIPSQKKLCFILHVYYLYLSFYKTSLS